MLEVNISLAWAKKYKEIEMDDSTGSIVNIGGSDSEVPLGYRRIGRQG